MQMNQELHTVLPELAHQSELLIAMFDQHDILRYANPAFQTVFAVRLDGSMSWSAMVFESYTTQRGVAIKTDNIEQWIASAYSRRGKLPFRAFESDLTDGRWIWMTETVQENGWMMCIASDITHLRQDGRELRQARDQALRAAQTDMLTSISNRRHISQIIQQAIQDMHQKSMSLHVALFDLDHFKNVNDSFGHAAGDLVLISFSRRLQACTRRDDACGRLGGEEFILCLPQLTTAQAVQVVERLLEDVRHDMALPDMPDFRYTTSAGLVQLRADETLEQVIDRADQALYQAKEHGRNRLVWLD